MKQKLANKLSEFFINADLCSMHVCFGIAFLKKLVSYSS